MFFFHLKTFRVETTVCRKNRCTNSEWSEKEKSLKKSTRVRTICTLRTAHYTHSPCPRSRGTDSSIFVSNKFYLSSFNRATGRAGYQHMRLCALNAKRRKPKRAEKGQIYLEVMLKCNVMAKRESKKKEKRSLDKIIVSWLVKFHNAIGGST